MIQDPQINAGHRAGGVAKADHQAAALQTVQRGFPGIFPYRVIDYGDFLTVGERFEPLRDRFFAIVNHLPGARRFGALRLLRAADGADKFRPQRFRPLTGNQPHAAGGGMKQEHLIRLNFVSFTQQIPDR